MGIPGLNKYIKNHASSALIPIRVRRTRLLIDGHNLMHNLAEFHSNSTLFFGGDYDSFVKQVDIFFEALEKCDIESCVVMDGGLALRRSAIQNGVNILRQSTHKIFHMTNVETSQLRPALLRSSFVAAVKRHGVTLLRSDEIADDDLTSMSVTLKLPVLTGDTDMFVLGAYVISLDSFDYRNVTLDAESGSYYIRAHIFDRQKYAEMHGISEKHVMLLSILSFQDFVSNINIFQVFKTIRGDRLMEEGEDLRMFKVKCVQEWLSARKHLSLHSVVKQITYMMPDIKRRTYRAERARRILLRITSPTYVSPLIHWFSENSSSSCRHCAFTSPCRSPLLDTQGDPLVLHSLTDQDLMAIAKRKASTTDRLGVLSPQRTVLDELRKSISNPSYCKHATGDLNFAGGLDVPEWLSAAAKQELLLFEVSEFFIRKSVFSQPFNEKYERKSAYLAALPILENVIAIIERTYLQLEKDFLIKKEAFLDSDECGLNPEERQMMKSIVAQQQLNHSQYKRILRKLQNKKKKTSSDNCCNSKFRMDWLHKANMDEELRRLLRTKKKKNLRQNSVKQSIENTAVLADLSEQRSGTSNEGSRLIDNALNETDTTMAKYLGEVSSELTSFIKNSTLAIEESCGNPEQHSFDVTERDSAAKKSYNSLINETPSRNNTSEDESDSVSRSCSDADEETLTLQNIPLSVFLSKSPLDCLDDYDNFDDDINFFLNRAKQQVEGSLSSYASGNCSVYSSNSSSSEEIYPQKTSADENTENVCESDSDGIVEEDDPDVIEESDESDVALVGPLRNELLNNVEIYDPKESASGRVIDRSLTTAVNGTDDIASQVNADFAEIRSSLEQISETVQIKKCLNNGIRSKAGKHDRIYKTNKKRAKEDENSFRRLNFSSAKIDWQNVPIISSSPQFVDVSVPINCSSKVSTRSFKFANMRSESRYYSEEFIVSLTESSVDLKIDTSKVSRNNMQKLKTLFMKTVQKLRRDIERIMASIQRGDDMAPNLKAYIIEHISDLIYKKIRSGLESQCDILLLQEGRRLMDKDVDLLALFGGTNEKNQHIKPYMERPFFWFIRKSHVKNIYPMRLRNEKSIAHLPSLQELVNLSVTERKELLCKILNESPKDLYSLPNNLQLIILCLCYWYNNSSLLLDQCHIYVLLLCIIVFLYIDSKIGKERDAEVIKYRLETECKIIDKKKLLLPSRKCSPYQVVTFISNNLDQQSCLLAAVQLNRYHKPDATIKPNEVDSTFVHGMSEFQASFLYISGVNTLLGSPFQLPSIEQVLNCTFAYNVFQEISNVQCYPGAFINENLAGKIQLIKLFEVLHDIVASHLHFPKVIDLYPKTVHIVDETGVTTVCKVPKFSFKERFKKEQKRIERENMLDEIDSLVKEFEEMDVKKGKKPSTKTSSRSLQKKSATRTT